MNIIICEGKNDAWFFDEIMKTHFADRMYTFYKDNNKNHLDKLQEMFGGTCYTYIKKQYSLIIYGDGGKHSITTALNRVVSETLGKNNDEISIILIRDEDGVPYDQLHTSLYEILEAYSKDKTKFTTYFPKLEQNNGLFVLNHPKSRGILKVALSTVPNSLEKQIASKTVEFKNCKDRKIPKSDSHEALDFLADKYYSGDKQMLIRESSTWLSNEAWVSNVTNLIT